MSLDRKILRLAWPAILSNISIPILGLSDTFISGHITGNGGAVYLAAMAVASTMINSLYWLFGFLRMGTTGLTATAFGAEDQFSQRVIFTKGFILALLLGALLILLSQILNYCMMHLLSPPMEVRGPASEYFLINIIGAPAMFATMVVIGRLIGRQNTLYTMIISISVNIFNIFLSATFVFLMHTGFMGVALGTAIANWTGLILALILAKRDSNYTKMFISVREAMNLNSGMNFFSVNAFLFLRSACMIAVTFAMTAFAGRLGALELASNAILLQLFLVFSYFMDGFAFSAEALCGAEYGRGDFPTLLNTVKHILLIGGGATLIFMLGYGIGITQIVSFLTDDSDVISNVGEMRWFAILIPLCSGAAFIYDGIYIGMARTGAMLLSTFLGMLIFFAVSIIPTLCGHQLSYSILWYAFLWFLLVRGITLAWLLRRIYINQKS